MIRFHPKRLDLTARRERRAHDKGRVHSHTAHGRDVVARRSLDDHEIYVWVCGDERRQQPTQNTTSEQLKGTVEVVEIVPPAVETEPTPGQATREGYLPLDAFADQVMRLLEQRPTSGEILVERVAFLSSAEAEGRLAPALTTLNAP